MRTEEKPMIARDELAARCLVSLLTRDGYDGDGAARDAVVAADALLSALAVPPAMHARIAAAVAELLDRDEIIELSSAQRIAYDKPDVVRHRFDVYMKNTQPMLKHYQADGRLKVINGMNSIDEVYADILRVVGK